MFATRRFSRLITRVIDIFLATAGLVVLGPIMVLIAVAIVVESGFPIFFAQTRLTKGGRHFQMYKFRKFGPREGTAGLPLTLAGDDRMTRVGGILCATKLDELPQLWNVLKGDMSVVGPRPETLAFADCFVGEYRAVLDHKSGIFGPSQVMFRSEGTLYRPNSDPTVFYREVLFPMKARLDLTYFSHRTVIGDLLWIVRSVLAVLGFGRRAQMAISAWPSAASVAGAQDGVVSPRPSYNTMVSPPIRSRRVAGSRAE
jgi:lipopolysaccharide/colanic/teichoic acid biosynthesis glycosyltransferase